MQINRVLLVVVSGAVVGLCLILLLLAKWRWDNATILVVGLLTGLIVLAVGLFRPNEIDKLRRSIAPLSTDNSSPFSTFLRANGLSWGVRLMALAGVAFAVLVSILGWQNWILAIALSSPLFAGGVLLEVLWVWQMIQRK